MVIHDSDVCSSKACLKYLDKRMRQENRSHASHNQGNFIVSISVVSLTKICLVFRREEFQKKRKEERKEDKKRDQAAKRARIDVAIATMPEEEREARKIDGIVCPPQLVYHLPLTAFLVCEQSIYFQN